jgi:hypothetical protein
MVIEDMKEKIDPQQFGNQKGLNIQHYLVQMMHRILSYVDNSSKGEVTAVLCLFVDWKSAYSHQCHKLGIESFTRNGVRPEIIPLLKNYFQGREMRVKFHGELSKSREQPGSGAQGATLGNHEFTSQTNNNADIVPEADRYKFVDDLSTLEKINLLSIGLASHNNKLQVPSDIPVHGQVIESENLKSQGFLDSISLWTKNQKMLLNEKKTKAMIVNFTEKYQFSTRLKLNKSNIELVNQMKILGTIIDNKLDWNQNCKELVQKVNKRMVFIRKMINFGASKEELVHLWVVYCRSVLEQSSVLWQGALTQENRDSLERTQKTFVKLILKNKYTTYEEALERLNLISLDKRRDILCLKFANKCLSDKKTSHMFPLRKKTDICETRNKEKYIVHPFNTERMNRSPIVYMQRLLNQNSRESPTS